MNSEDIKSAAKNLGDSAGRTGDDIKKSAQSSTKDIAGDAQGYAAQAGDTANDLYGRAKDSVRGATDTIQSQAAEALSAGKRAYEGGSDQFVRQVSKQPLEALLLAGAIGYLVGWATNRS